MILFFIKKENSDLEFDFWIYNPVGQMIDFGKNNFNDKINIEEINSGIYFIKIKSREDIITKRFVKN